MATTIEEVMTPDPVTMPASATAAEAAKAMRDRDVGDVIVTEGNRICGIVTDRDIAVRAVAAGRDPNEVTLTDIASKDLITLSPTSSLGEAVQLMRDRAIRRIPVVEGGKAVGFVSMGDLAVEQDPRSALADISAAPPNH